MKKTTVGIVGASLILLAAVTGTNHPQQNNSNNQQVESANAVVTKQVIKPKPVCDGSSVTQNCVLDNITYKTYVYHPAIAEKSHTEQVTTYEKKVTGYCTLCQDNTYSPSCATGRGACSYHGGVAQWNAPRYSNVPVYSTKTVIDAPAQDAYYDKVPE